MRLLTTGRSKSSTGYVLTASVTGKEGKLEEEFARGQFQDNKTPEGAALELDSLRFFFGLGFFRCLAYESLRCELEVFPRQPSDFRGKNIQIHNHEMENDKADEY